MKLLIVDDEIQIRTGLAEGIDWEEVGVSEVETSENGIEALEYCQINQPEIVLTDICMPGLSGLELGKQIVEMYAPVKVIILSGYSEFEYAKEAVRLGAFDYLLKPIHIPDLMKCVIQAQKAIEKERSNQQCIRVVENIQKKQEIESVIQSGVLLTQEKYDLLQGNIQINLKKQIIVGVYAPDTEDSSLQNQICAYLTNLFQKDRKLTSSQILLGMQGKLYFISEIFSNAEYQRKKEILINECENCNRILATEFHVTVSCAVSRIGDGNEVALLAHECEKLTKNRLHKGGGCIFFTEDSVSREEMTLSPINRDIVKNYVERFDYTLMHEYLIGVFQTLRENQVTSIGFTKGICLELKNILISTVSEKGVDVKNILKENELLINDIPNYCILEKYLTWIDNLYYLILNGMSQLVGKQHSRAIIKAIDFISRNYADDINLEVTAEEVSKSKNYFSYLFKKETGVSFVEYLNRVRIDNAKILLNSTDQMTYEIAEQVGYNDYKYFSSIFKKMTGTSPAQYRKSGLLQKGES